MRKVVSVLLCAALSATAAPIDPREEAFIGNRRSYWAFQKVVRPAVPANGAANPIDNFIREGLKAKKLTPSSEASKRTLIRRASLDLTGMPPANAEVEAFLKDNAKDAYEKLVDRLLASPAYGERWALKWLDVVRYADTNGYELDAERPQAWRYRDYVINSFNSGKPYDRFLMEQIAGDELYPGNSDALIATGFLRAGPRHVVGGNTDEEVNRQEVLLEMTLGVSNTFLGLTVGCARCHNHKFDPITQADHYRIQAIMAATDLKEIEYATKEEKQKRDVSAKALMARIKPLDDEIAAIEKPYREQLKEAKKLLLTPAHRAVLDIPKDKRTPEQEVLAKEANKQIGLSWDEVVNALPPDVKAKRAAIRAERHKIALDEPEEVPTAFAVANMEKAPVTHILKIGDPKHKLDTVEPAFLSVLGGLDAPKGPADRRSAFAKWLADPAHPLTARVMANRIWQFRMGSGIVSTPNDFGQLGGRPSNRPLLDWLAAEFVSSGWNVRHLDRLIVTSAAYRQSADIDESKASVDADNKLYWRMNQRRLEGESLRDGVLQASGKLNPKQFGAPIKTPIEPEIYDIIFTEGEPDNLWPLPKDRSEVYRKSIYLLNKRTVRLPMLTNFDQPDAITSCPVRAVSTHALQALSLLNSAFMQEQSEALAARVNTVCRKGGAACQIRTAYELTLQRPPRPKEQQMARQFLTQKRMPLEDFCKALLNRHEFVYIP
ncbi:MAG: DUF1549 domain-containing protein [Acidobacteria bacterium]|nr:DUF1549 domain-containing protein [Acidobacteriota bacterium]